MDKIKNKYEILLGFATLIISLSAFKQELSRVTFNLGYITTNLAEYLLFLVCGLSICIYFYILERVLTDTKIGVWKLFGWLIQAAYFISIKSGDNLGIPVV